MRTLSSSQVTAYLGCPLKYRFRYVDRIPAPWRPAALAFGSSIHAAVEWFHRERLGGRTPPVEKVIAIFNADWYAQNVEPLVFSDRESKDLLTTRGRDMLAVYVAETDGRMPVLIEEAFEVDIADPTNGELLDVRLRGFMDLVEAGEIVTDLKTAARGFSAGDVARHLQLSIYALVYLLLHDRLPKLRLDVLLKTREPRLDRHETTRTLEDLAWTARLIRQVGSAIESGHFFPNPSWRCGDCEYFAHCQAWRG